ncbi:AbrB family transcriptional regulator [Nioella aestuarii]|uniref:AbrB family transcriptional regulator n=1 Tax=Nioella aestuarii TaxID=1662864 RepID=UPI003D7FDA26
MSSGTILQSTSARTALALLIGIASGIFAFLIGMPLPWMLGPMIGNTIAAILHAPTAPPAKLRPIVIPVIGVMLGSGVTPEIVDALGDWAISFLVLPPFLIVAAGASFLFYRFIGKYDPVTAYFSAMPGGLNEMLILGAEQGGDEKRIALAHASRILLVIGFVALFFGLILGVTSGGQGSAVWVGLWELGLKDYAVLAICAVAGVYVGKLLRLPAAAVLGPMLLSGIAHFFHIVDVPPPTVLVIAAQVVMGTVIGCRFIGATAREVGQDLFLGVFSTIGMLITGVGFAAVVAALTDTDLSQAFLAYSPGGLTEMSLLAFAMGGDIAYVSLTHIVRIVLVIFSAPLVFRWFGRSG